ncbi:S-adenosyl-L-methionine-dependent methyltransferase [Pterulicium gracile]|uniref:S-adenosyl-L-methionine-dependent methyltransferase n=1 Tax=Pterulicium gracile TaxID=1884261 RepID=A0A5C3Q2K9_9AGAR|nr:S-adenosyl-L-methionine-dependent methyltransferase [Pterula gracilis]
MTSPSSDNPLTTLQALGSLITTSITALEAVYASHSTPFPSLDTPWQPHPLEKDQQVAQASAVIMSAAYQLIASVGTPIAHLSNTHGAGAYVVAALRYVVEGSVADVLKEGGGEGMHVDEIARKMKSPPADNSPRVLRFLATRHVFREITPNVFANNRTSSALCKAKSLKEIHEVPAKQYDGLTAASLVGHVADEGFLSATHLSSWLQAPQTTAGPSPFTAAHQVNDVWKWYEELGNEMRRSRFTGVMKSFDDGAWTEELFTGAIDWASYPENATVVDVGGSLGIVTLLLARKFPHLKYVVQDLPKVIEVDAKKFWNHKHPEFVENGKVVLQPHDFFTPNPIKQADVYFLRNITHDWATPLAASILKHLRDAAKPTTKLILFDFIMPYACKDPNATDAGLGAPWPLLANFGLPLGGTLTFADMHMMNMFGAQERTVGEFAELGALSGWKVENIVRGLGGAYGATVYTSA